MTREDLISYLSQHLGWTESDTTKALEAFLDTVVEELMAGNRVDIGGFGLFQARKQSEYILVNREENERYLMPPTIEIVFEAAETIDAIDTSDTSDTSLFVRDTIHFIPDESIEKEVNSSFMLFEPTLLNEGMQFPDLIEVYAYELEKERENLKEEQVNEVESVEELPDESSEGPNIVPEEQLIVATLPESDYIVLDEATDNHEENDREPTEELINVATEEPSEVPEIAAMTASPSEPVYRPTDPISRPVEPISRRTETISRPAIGKRRRKRAPIWVPVLGGVAIALTVLFFFKAVRTGKAINGTSESPLHKANTPASQRNAVSTHLDQATVRNEQYAPQRAEREVIVLMEGMTLRLLAEELYGNREFWIYIYMENKERIPNPNRVAHGLKLLLPDSSLYDIDPSNPESIAKAKSLGDEVLNRK